MRLLSILWWSTYAEPMAKRGQRRRVRAFVQSGLAAGMVAASSCADTHSDNGARPTEEGTPDGTLPNTGGTFAEPIDAGNPFEETPSTPQQLPVGFLSDQKVSSEQPQLRVLYSWTTQEQYDQLRAGGELLTRTESPTQGPGLIRQVLADLAAGGNELAQALTTPEFQKARYAWPNPWATLVGWEDESYGDRLIRVELREDAWLVVLNGAEFQIFDLSGAQVASADALANPQRIGAVFHVHVTDDLFCGGSFTRGGSGSFREYFLPNAAMIASWSLDTQEMRERLVADRELLALYRDYQQTPLAETPYSFETWASCNWQGGWGGSGGPLDAYVHAMAVASPLYNPSVENLNVLIEALDHAVALFDPVPFVHTGP